VRKILTALAALLLFAAALPAMGNTSNLKAKSADMRTAAEEKEMIKSIDILENYDVLLNMDMLLEVEKKLDDEKNKGDK
jgi:hypothetical protein